MRRRWGRATRPWRKVATTWVHSCTGRETDAARALYEESLALRRKLGDHRGIAEGLEGLAGVAAAACGSAPRRTEWHRRGAERAARLFGAAEVLRVAIGTPLPPAARPAYDRAVAAARVGLDGEVFAAAWAAGRANTPEEAVAFALDRGSRTGSSRAPANLVVAGRGEETAR